MRQKQSINTGARSEPHPTVGLFLVGQSTKGEPARLISRKEALKKIRLNEAVSVNGTSAILLIQATEGWVRSGGSCRVDHRFMQQIAEDGMSQPLNRVEGARTRSSATIKFWPQGSRPWERKQNHDDHESSGKSAA